MTLRELVEQLESLDDELTLYAEGGPDASASAAAVAAPEPADGSLPTDAAGLEYLLEVDAAKEVLDVWSKWRNGATPTLDDKLKAILHYAKSDAYLPAG